MSFQDTIDRAYAATIDDNQTPERCTRSFASSRCEQSSVTKCSHCPEAPPVCEDHNFGTEKEPMCFACLKVRLDEIEAEEVLAAARIEVAA